MENAQREREAAEQKRQNASAWFGSETDTALSAFSQEGAPPAVRQELLTAVDPVNLSVVGDTERKKKGKLQRIDPSLWDNPDVSPLAGKNFDTFAAEHRNNPDYWDAIKWAQSVVHARSEIEQLDKDEEIRNLAAQRTAKQCARAPICGYRGQQRAAQ